MLKLNKFPYPEMRDIQKTTLKKLKDNWDDYRYFVLELPTGAGKSAIGKTICGSYNNGFLITATKQLQDQYINDFGHLGDIKSIKGKANYVCNYNPDLNCEIGPCEVDDSLKKECKKYNRCEYYKARDAALQANAALTSYQYFLRATECAGFWKPRNVVVFDECHLLEQQIVQWAEIEIKPRELDEKFSIFDGMNFSKMTSLSIPPEEAGYQENKRWIKDIYTLIKKRRKEIEREIKATMSNSELNQMNQDEIDEVLLYHEDYYEIDKLYKRLDVFFNTRDCDWIIEPEDDGLVITPIKVNELFQKFVDKQAIDKIIFMSATVIDLPGFCKELGLSKEQTGLIQMDPIFPPKKSPIVYYPTGKMNYKQLNKTIPKINNNVEKILKYHKDQKGIIHTGNYRIARAICNDVNSNRLIMKQDDESNEQLLSRHINSNDPTVLVSPSLYTGADLKEELSRFQIAVKLPWSSLKDKRVKAKLDNNNNSWYAAQMFRSFIQSCGRSTRSHNDWSTTYVLDSSFKYWINRYKKWFSQKFLERIVWNKDNFLNKKE
jgi:Rad3-related DNA helicase